MSEYIHHQEEDETTGLILKVIADPDPLNPRVDYEEACTMCCDHGRYELGDKDGHEKAREAIRNSKHYEERWEEHGTWEDDEGNDIEGEGLDFTHGPDLYKAIQRCHDIVLRCLFLYDHSGITIRTSPFACPWDSGMVGFAFMTEDDMKKTYMVDAVTDEIRERARSLIDGEVSTYDKYLTGDVWGYVIEGQDGEEVDSCWGIFGSEYAEEEGQAAYKAEIESAKQDNAFMDKLGIPAVPA